MIPILNENFPFITWVDVETNGLFAASNSLLEVACLITDTDLNIVDEAGYSAAIYYPESYVEILKSQTSEYVVNMHAQTNLWDRLTSEGKMLSQVDEELTDYVKNFIPEARTSWLGGNSITLDRNFLEANLPNAFNHLHYRSVDVTAVAGLARWWYGVEFSKKLEHNAFSDIKESIDELRFLRKSVFK